MLLVVKLNGTAIKAVFTAAGVSVHVEGGAVVPLTHVSCTALLYPLSPVTAPGTETICRTAVAEVGAFTVSE